MLDFDQSRCWIDLEKHLVGIEGPRQRQLLGVVIEHVKAEVDRSVDRLMATLVDDPAYHFWVGGRDVGPKGRDGIRAYYEDFVAGGGAVFESRKDRVIVDDHTVSHEGPVRNLVPGSVAKRRGYTVPDASAHYLVRFRNCVWWSFDDAGLALGEDSYTTYDVEDWDAVAAEDLPECYTRYLAEISLPF